MIRQQTFNGSHNKGQIYAATHGRGLFTSEHYSTKSNELINMDGDLKLFPNPSNKIINFDFKKRSNEEIFVQIINLNGQIVFSKKQIDNSVDVSDLSIGNYVITVQTSDNFYSTKFIKK